VEVQLVMQLLDRRSALRLARCSRRMLQCASQPFAWQGGDLLEIDVSDEPFRSRPFGQSLLRFVPVRLRIRPRRGVRQQLYYRVTPRRGRLDGINLSTPRRAANDPKDCEDKLRQFMQAHGAQLHTVALDSYPILTTSFLGLLQAGVPALQTLSLRPFKEGRKEVWDASRLVPLAACPALTQLDVVVDNSAGSSLPLLEPLLQCTHLRRLDLHGDAQFKAGEMRSFLTRLGSSCPALEHLSWIFDALCVKPATRPAADDSSSAESDDEKAEGPRLSHAEFAGAFATLTQLRTMQLHADDVTTEALGWLSELRQLRLLRVPWCTPATEQPVRALLARLPQLRVESLIHSVGKSRNPVQWAEQLSREERCFKLLSNSSE